MTRAVGSGSKRVRGSAQWRLTVDGKSRMFRGTERAAKAALVELSDAGEVGRYDLIGTGRWQLRYRRRATYAPYPGSADGPVRLTESDAEKALTRFKKAVDEGKFRPVAKITLSSFLRDEWLPSRQADVKPATLKGYRGVIARYIDEDSDRAKLGQQLGRKRLSSIKYADVVHLFDAMKRQGLSRATIAHVRFVLHSAFNYAVAMDVIDENPIAGFRLQGQREESRRRRNRMFNDLSRENARRVLDELRSGQWYAPSALAAVTGSRRSEVLAIRWDDVDLEDATLRIDETIAGGEFGTPKSAESMRTITLSPMGVELLRRERAEQNERRLLLGRDWRDLGLVFDDGVGGPRQPGSMTQAFARAAERAGVRMRLHDLRHLFASELIGTEPLHVVSALLGHSRATFTAEVYGHPSEEQVRQTARVVGERLDGLVVEGGPRVRGSAP